MRGAYIRMNLAIFLWGFTGLLGKKILLNEGMLVWYRMLISALCIFLILFFRRSLPRLSPKKWLQISGIGVLVMLHWLTFYGSIKASSISVAMICLSSIAMFASILEPLANKQRFDYVEIFFSALAIVGISSIYFSDVNASIGVILGVISSLLSAIFSILNRKIASDHEPLTISFIELSAGWLMLTLLLPLYFSFKPTDKFIPDFTDSIYLLILAIVCTVLTWILSLQALQKVSAYTMALALNLEPIYGIILAVLYAEEAKFINGWFIAGSLIILFTVICHTWYKFRKSKKAILI